jgi:hypothetical protein
MDEYTIGYSLNPFTGAVAGIQAGSVQARRKAGCAFDCVIPCAAPTNTKRPAKP